jgi:hypothetical protein
MRFHNPSKGIFLVGFFYKKKKSIAKKRKKSQNPRRYA